MEDILPNWAILKSPMNWFLVAFALALIAIICHLVFKDKEL